MIVREELTVVTDTGNNADKTTDKILNGKILSVVYQADGTNPYPNTVDFTITVEKTGQVIWQESNIAAAKTVSPRTPTHGTDGAAALYAAGGAAVGGQIAVPDSRIRVQLAQGGNTKSGKFIFILEQ